MGIAEEGSGSQAGATRCQAPWAGGGHPEGGSAISSGSAADQGQAQGPDAAVSPEMGGSGRDHIVPTKNSLISPRESHSPVTSVTSRGQAEWQTVALHPRGLLLKHQLQDIN